MNSVYWLIALAVFLAIEIGTLGLTTIWFAGGSLVAFAVALFGGPLWLQYLLFLLVSFGLLIFTRPFAKRCINGHHEKTNYESLIGKEARVTETIDNVSRTGKADLNGQEWTARTSKDGVIKQPGDRVIVVDIQGVKLIVE